jgi:hypothetical protein
MSTSPTSPPTAADIRRQLELLGLDPAGVDLDWIARVKHETEQKIAAACRSPELAEALAVVPIPPAG